ncbi:MAG: polysaccharide biosynthesis protein [Candidatus Peribacteraceae bacterium]|nr:polysaccharide biosynthesis protein [Candidatus Peribacteraceae bacterium]
MNNIFNNKIILITGGTGSVGMEIARRLHEYKPKAIRIFSNDEDGLFHTMNEFKEFDEFRYFLGNIERIDRLNRAMEDVDIVFHAAALKHVQICEYNPFEAVETNVNGMQNLINSAIDNDVERVLYTSSDKAVNPSNMMGVSKLMGEKLITTANFFKGKHRTIFSTIRFGNVIGSRGSFIPFFNKQIEAGGPITLTDKNMSRYILVMNEAIDNVFRVLDLSRGGEIFIPKMRAIDISDIAEWMIEEKGKDGIGIKEIGLKPGEKIYEELITDEEGRRTVEYDNFYVVIPQFTEFQSVDYSIYENLPRVDNVLRSDEAVKMSKDETISLLKKESLL